eukprot:6173939-Pleurochrysis_carterae.AAC.3
MHINTYIPVRHACTDPWTPALARATKHAQKEREGNRKGKVWQLAGQLGQNGKIGQEMKCQRARNEGRRAKWQRETDNGQNGSAGAQRAPECGVDHLLRDDGLMRQRERHVQPVVLGAQYVRQRRDHLLNKRIGEI